MACISYEQVMKILKQTEGKAFLEAMDSYDWTKGFIPMDTPSCGDGTFEDRIRRQTTRTVPPQGYLLADLPNDPKIATSPLPSTPKSVEPDKDHIWNMIVLAAQSSRYGS
jgi:hypothetical protein